MGRIKNQEISLSLPEDETRTVDSIYDALGAQLSTTLDTTEHNGPARQFDYPYDLTAGIFTRVGPDLVETVTTLDEAYRVELGVATVALAIPHEPSEVAGNERLDAFLARRGLYPSLGRIIVAEGVLADGDQVEVEGVVRSGTREETYRHVGRVRYLREERGAPLTIRRV